MTSVSLVWINQGGHPVCHLATVVFPRVSTVVFPRVCTMVFPKALWLCCGYAVLQFWESQDHRPAHYIAE